MTPLGVKYQTCGPPPIVLATPGVPADYEPRHRGLPAGNIPPLGSPCTSSGSPSPDLEGVAGTSTWWWQHPFCPTFILKYH